MVSGDLLTSGRFFDNAATPEGRALGWRETVIGAVLMGWSLLDAVAIRSHPAPNLLDRWGFAMVADAVHSAVLLRITDLGTPAVLVVGAVLAALLSFPRDRFRSAACLAGPLLAVVLAEYVFKPLVGRRYQGVLSYPSGTVTAVTAVATAWVLTAPPRIRPAVMVVAVLAVCLTGVAVTGLRWHYPTDALAGVALGVGTVLLVDGTLHLSWRIR
jgi:hypothetical protein